MPHQAAHRTPPSGPPSPSGPRTSGANAPAPSSPHDFRGLTDWVHAFTAGPQTDSRGRTESFSSADLDKIVANHDPAHPPPHVITHNELYSPFRFGDIAEVKRDGDKLFVKSGRVSEQLDKLVGGGYLPDRSLRLLKTDNGYKIGHLAWLGSQPPAVEGLEPVEYAASTEAMDFMLGAGNPDTYTPNLLQRVMRRLREYFVAEKGVETADRLMPEYELEALGDHVGELDRDTDPATEYSQGKQPDPDRGDTDMSKDFTQADMDAAAERARAEAKAEAQAETDRLNADLAKAQQASRRIEFAREVADLAVDGEQVRLTPAQQVGVADFMAQLADAEDAKFDFAAGTEDKPETKKATPLAFFRDFLKRLGPQLTKGEADLGEGPEAGSGGDFTAAPGYAVDEASLKLHHEALDYQAKHEGVDYATAVDRVSRGRG